MKYKRKLVFTGNVTIVKLDNGEEIRIKHCKFNNKEE